ncbi:MAG TPA: MarR family transcriptional regulator [Chloroflexota bacterium]|nr:MarR family transcriptional regulator [Chloroflexota bacterium]
MAEPRWLSADEQKTWLAFLLATRLLWARFERDVQREAGIPLTYYEILSALSETTERAMRMADLSRILQVSPSRLSHAIARLEESGWVRRELCRSDRRGWIAVLTAEGVTALEGAAPAHVESVRRHLFDQLTDRQVAELGVISSALLAHLAPGTDIPGVIERRKSLDSIPPRECD